MELIKYLNAFIDEANDNVHALNRYLLELEQSPGCQAPLNGLYRSAHTLKASSQTMGFNRMSKLTHDMETVVCAAGEGRIEQDAYFFDLLFRCIDGFESFLFYICEYGNEGGDVNEDIIQEIENLCAKKRLIKQDGMRVEGVCVEGVRAESLCAGPAYGDDVRPESAYGDGAGSEPAYSGDNSAEPEYSGELGLEVAGSSENAKYDAEIQKALGTGRRAFEIKFALARDCLMKAARAFIIISALEKHGEIARCSPKIEDIEDEKFDHDFTLTLLTNNSDESLSAIIAPLSEIRRFDIVELRGGADLERAASLKRDASGKTVRVSVRRLDTLNETASDLNRRIEQLAELLLQNHNERESEQYGQVSESIEKLGQASLGLREAVVELRTMSISDIFVRFPETCGEIAKKLGKEVELDVNCGDARCELSVVSELGQPLIHILRNSIDHGIEKPEVRKAAGKDARGKVSVRAASDGADLVIEIEDDGAGIDTGKLRKKAVETGVFDETEARYASREEVMRLILLPSFSTRNNVSLYSGRGMGMDIVKAITEGFGGDIGIESEEGRGTKIKLRLPGAILSADAPKREQAVLPVVGRLGEYIIAADS